MFLFHYTYCDHLEYLHQLARYAGVPVVNNAITLPPHMGTGYIKVVELANGLQVLINECVLHEEVTFQRAPAMDESFTLRFDEVKNLKRLSLRIDDDQLQEEERFYSGAFLSNSLCELSYTANAGTEDRCVNIYFTAAWLKDHVGIDAHDVAFTRYLSLKTASINFEVLHVEYRSMMEDIFETGDDHPMQKVILHNRTMLLLEKFFRSLFSRMGTGQGKRRAVNEQDMMAMMKVEALLVHNLAVAPPTITMLARAATMSETKLKNCFKAVYGHNIYEYYQKNRMLKARQLLHSKKCSVKETGIALGFKNLSNFTIAYKKAFNQLPSESLN